MSNVKNLVFTWWRYALAVLVVLALGWYFFFSGGASSNATLLVQAGDFTQKVSVSGTVIAAKDVDLGFAASGRISGVYARVGQRMVAGTVVTQTENGDLVAVLAQKRAVLASAQADLASLQVGTRPEEIAVAAASVASAESTLVDAIKSAYTTSDDAVHNKVDAFFTNPRTEPKLTFIVSNTALKSAAEQDRVDSESALVSFALLISKLTNDGSADSATQAQKYLAQVVKLMSDSNAALNQGVPDNNTSASTISSHQTTLATARTNVNSAITTLTNATTALESAKKNLSLKKAGSTPEAISAQTATVASASADVDNAKAALAKTYVTAPFSGIVTRMDAKVGEIVSPTASLISMQSDGIFQIETFVPEVAIAGVEVGDGATTTLDAYGSSEEFSSKVIAIDPAETMKDGVPAYKTTLSFFNADTRIRSGMTANVVITTGTLLDSVVIPSGAIGNKNGTSYVSVVIGDKTNSRTVTLGISPALGQTHVLSGLVNGDVILLTPEP